MFFTVKVWNFANDALNVQFHVVNESGKVVYPQKGGWVSKYIPKGAENYTLTSFDRDVFGIGDHTYTVVARISGEEENDSVTIKVTPSNGTLKQVGFECSDLYFKYDMGNYKAALTCRLSIFNGYPYPVFINNSVVSTISISPKTLAKYLRSRILIDTVSNRTILSKRYLTIASTAYFFVPKQDLPLLLSKIFPQLADAGADVKVENIVIHTTTATVNMTYNLTLDIQGELKIKRYRVTSIIHVKVDQVAVVADILADVGLTYGAFKGVNAVTDVSLFKKFITKVPPKYRYALGFLGQISLNDIKEQIITTVSG
ncbi:hypothetical protein [Thermococcus sp.]|uniref:hypothetical protein n=1 Tax=Thermococcus sp. TaxID=35749 RepID=UPI00260EE154|nr:hypothetical protein [Thermococcus sp.]